MLQTILTGLETINVTSYKRLEVSLLSQDGYKIPYRNLLKKIKGERPLPITIKFNSPLPDNAVVYAEIDGKNKRECSPINSEFGLYQLSFFSDDFLTVGVKPLRIYFKMDDQNILEYVQEKFDFEVSYKERQV